MSKNRKKIIIILVVLFDNFLSSSEQFPRLFSYSAYSEDVQVIFQSPAGAYNFSKMQIDASYGSLFNGLLKNNLSNMDFAFGYNRQDILINFGYRNLSLTDIYSLNAYIFNFSKGFFSNRIFLGANIKSYVYKYTLDEYYQRDTVASSPETNFNLDLGIRYLINENIYSALSFNNVLANTYGDDVVYLLPRRMVFGVAYKKDSTIINIEYINEIFEIKKNERYYDQNTLRLGVSQTVQATERLVLVLSSGLDKDYNYTSFYLGSQLNILPYGITLKYFYSYPVTTIKGFWGNNFLAFTLKIGSSAKLPVKKVEKKKEETDFFADNKYKDKMRSKIKTKTSLNLNDELYFRIYNYSRVYEIFGNYGRILDYNRFNELIEDSNKIEKGKQKNKQEQKDVSREKTVDNNQRINQNEILPQKKEDNFAQQQKEYKESKITDDSIEKGYIIEPKKLPLPKEKNKESEKDSKKNIIKEANLKIQSKDIANIKFNFPLAHKVSEGDNLVSLAKKYYNDEKYWQVIYNANKEKIIKGRLIVGDVIIIPEPYNLDK